MLGVDDRLITPTTMKWVKVGLIAGLATIPTTILLYYVLGLAVDAAVEGSNLLRQWFWLMAALVLAKAALAWLFRTGQFRLRLGRGQDQRARAHLPAGGQARPRHPRQAPHRRDRQHRHRGRGVPRLLLQRVLRADLGGDRHPDKGEVCAAGSRLLVERPVHEAFVASLAERAEATTLGDPREKGTRMGPVVSEEQMQTVLGYIESGKTEGARLVAGGRRAEDVNGGKGFFVRPTVFDAVSPAMTIAREEIFGPVLSVLPFEGLEEAAALANATAYGLAAGVWTRDVAKAHPFARSVRAGTVWVNAYNLYDPALPFGGFGQSGFGRELGLEALDAYLEGVSGRCSGAPRELLLLQFIRSRICQGAPRRQGALGEAVARETPA